MLTDDIPDARNARSLFARPALALAYSSLLLAVYALFLAPSYEGFGSGWVAMSTTRQLSAIALAVSPSLLLPRRFARPSQLLLLVQYYVVYIPTIVLLPHVVRPQLPAQSLTNAWTALWSGMILLLLLDLTPRLAITRPALSQRGFAICLIVPAALLLSYLVALLGRNFQFADLEAMYDVRAAAVDLIDDSGSRLGAYALMWLPGAFLPLIFVYCLDLRRYALAALALLPYLFLLGIGGAKTSLIAVILLPALYIGQSRRAELTWTFPLALMGLFILAFPINAFGPAIASVGFNAAVLERTFAVPALLTSQYVEFFRSHPLTYFSHLRPITVFVTYPYDWDLPRLIGLYFYDLPVGSNAGLWLGDGIAALGLVGIPVSSAFAAIFFWILDSVAGSIPARTTGSALGFAAVTFANTSFGTTLLSGGLTILLFAFMLYPRDIALRTTH